jgi:glycosyltransferase involved in cell wall biosynthesis
LHHLFAADIVNVHSLHAPGGFAEFEAFFRVVPRHVPVVRTMHDMNFFTGGCHYAEGCTKYTGRCGACPELRSTHEDDLSRQIWRRKHRALSSVPTNRVHLVAPSQWLAAEARRSSLAARFPSTVIPYGLDLDVFRPRDRDAARLVLGLSPDTRVVLFIAEPISRRFKGFTLLANALAGLPDRHTLMLIAVGSGRAPITPDLPFLHLGWVGNDRLLSMIYSAADLFVIPSSMENFAQTAVQALACGTPVIGSDVGGIPEIVRPGITGLLAPPHDATALGAAITALLNDPERRRQMSENCRQIALAEYSVELYAKRSLALYQTVIAQQGSIENNVLHKTPTVALRPIAAKLIAWLFGVEG